MTSLLMMGAHVIRVHESYLAKKSERCRAELLHYAGAIELKGLRFTSRLVPVNNG